MSHSGGKTADELAADAEAIYENMPVLELCARCPGWRFEGPVREAREAFAEHMAEAHADVRFQRGSEALKAARARARAAERAERIAERKDEAA